MCKYSYLGSTSRHPCNKLATCNEVLLPAQLNPLMIIGALLRQFGGFGVLAAAALAGLSFTSSERDLRCEEKSGHRHPVGRWKPKQILQSSIACPKRL